MSRVSLHAPVGWSEFQRTTLGKTFSSARVAERKRYDWERIRAQLDVPDAEIKAMSERSLFADNFSDAKVESIVRSELPWLATPGYPVYNPSELAVHPGFRRHWFQPYCLYDKRSDSLNLRHCYQCGSRLSDERVEAAFTTCRCGVPLSAGPTVKAPASIVALADRLAEGLSGPLAGTPQFDSPTVRATNVAWRIAGAFERVLSLNATAADACEVSGMGELTPRHAGSPWSADATVAAAIRHAQLLSAATRTLRDNPDIETAIYEAGRTQTKPQAVDEVITALLQRRVAASELQLVECQV